MNYRRWKMSPKKIDSGYIDLDDSMLDDRSELDDSMYNEFLAEDPYQYQQAHMPVEVPGVDTMEMTKGY